MEEHQIDPQIRNFLGDYDKFQAYVEELIGDLDDKGRKWEEIAREIVPNTDLGKRFDWPEIVGNHDEGVDLIARTEDGSAVLYVQAKYGLNRVDKLDETISKFRNYYIQHHVALKTPTQLKLPGSEEEASEPEIFWMIITNHNIKKYILPKYLQSKRSSREFYDELDEEGRIEIVDGPKIWAIASQAWEYKFGSPPTLELESVEGWLKLPGSVYIGVISSKELQRIYKESGDALFFENVRDFQGYKKGGVNEAIRKTVVKHPELLLSKNNGLVMRAEKVAPVGDNKLSLTEASVVNGVQTTFVVNENAAKECFLQVKVVETSKPWDLTNAANFQNQVHRIDLEIAQFMRPQLVERLSYRSGVVIDKDNEREKKLFDLRRILGAAARTRMSYRDVRFLFLGLFSDTPRNIFIRRYDRIPYDVLELYSQNDQWHFLYETIFELYKTERESIERTLILAEVDEEEMFGRLTDVRRSRYVQYLTILAACVAVETDISDRHTDHKEEYKRSIDFFNKLRAVIEQQPSEISVLFAEAYQTLTSSILVEHGSKTTQEIRSAMASDIEYKRFTNLYTAVRMYTRRVQR